MTGKAEAEREVARALPLRQLLVALVRPHRAALALALALLTAQSLVVLLQPWLGGLVASRLLGSGGSLAPLLWGLFALVLAQAVLGYAQSVLLQAVSGQLVADAGARLYAHLQALPLAWHDARRRGDVMALLLGDIRRLAGFLTGVLLPLLPLLLTFFGAQKPWDLTGDVFAIFGELVIPITVRLEDGEPVPGHLVLARRA